MQSVVSFKTEKRKLPFRYAEKINENMLLK